MLQPILLYYYIYMHYFHNFQFIHDSRWCLCLVETRFILMALFQHFFDLPRSCALLSFFCRPCISSASTECCHAHLRWLSFCLHTCVSSHVLLLALYVDAFCLIQIQPIKYLQVCQVASQLPLWRCQTYYGWVVLLCLLYPLLALYGIVPACQKYFFVVQCFNFYLSL